MEFSELFTQSAREVLPRAREKNLVSYFDHDGPRVRVGFEDNRLKCSIHRLLLGIVDCFDSGFVMFKAAVSTPVYGHSAIVVHAAGTGHANEPGIEAVLARLKLHSVPDTASIGHRPRAEGICPALGGRVQFVDAGSDGLVLSLEVSVEASEVQHALPLPNAGGATAWLVSPIAGALDSVEIRLRQLGWRVKSFPALPQASDEPPDRPPMLLIAMERSPQDMRSVEAFARENPIVWTVLAVVAGSETLRLRGETPVDIRVLPLSPLEIERFTAHVDASISGVQPRETSPAPVYVQESRRILVVDDNVVNQLIARGQLEALGYNVIVADDGLEALDSCCDEPPDMVLMDVDMPLMNGLEASEHLREMQREGTLPPFPIIAATSGDPTKRADCFKAGMDGYLSKPMDLRTLADELHRVLPSRPSGLDEAA